jgi:arginyl-tRNA synthetase
VKKLLEKVVREAVLEEFGEEVASKVSFVVSAPPKLEMGDYATNVAMVLAKELKKSPQQVAEAVGLRIQEKGSNGGEGSNEQQTGEKGNAGSHAMPLISKVEILGGFINFHLKPEIWFKEVTEEISTQKSEYGTLVVENPEKIMVEYLSPNTNKPLHLGHLRNGVTGVAVINALSAAGHKVIKAEIINDRGVHICKAMLAYQKYGNGEQPAAGVKPDHFVGEWYVRFAQEAEKDPSLEEQAQDMLRKWEAGDPEVRAIWNNIRQWVLEGWKQTEDLLGFTFDKVYFESEVYELGRDIIEQGLAKGVFRKNEKGNTVFDLPPEEFGTDEAGQPKMITVLRADGTSLYYTQDLGLQTSRVAEYHLDRIVHVVGSEQNFYFQALFAIFKALGYPWAEKLYHLSYAMVYLPDGKMKSREGTVVDTDELVAQIVDLAKAEIDDRTKGEKEIAGEEREKRARAIALGAIKFYLLKQKPIVDIHFNPKESISFEGFTGPYCQYAYARARSILRQVESIKYKVESQSINYSLVGDSEERQLLQRLEIFPEVVSRAAEECNPALIATHVFETAQAFNSFYTSHPVLKAESEELMTARAKMVEVSAQVIKNGLALLGIETLEEM